MVERWCSGWCCCWRWCGPAGTLRCSGWRARCQFLRARLTLRRRHRHHHSHRHRHLNPNRPHPRLRRSRFNHRRNKNARVRTPPASKISRRINPAPRHPIRHQAPPRTRRLNLHRANKHPRKARHRSPVPRNPDKLSRHKVVLRPPNKAAAHPHRSRPHPRSRKASLRHPRRLPNQDRPVRSQHKPNSNPELPVRKVLKRRNKAKKPAPPVARRA